MRSGQAHKRKENTMSWIDNTANNTLSSENDYSKEFHYINQFKWLIDFNIFTKPTLCESRFFETIAWYIDCLQKEDETTWEQKIQELIDSIITFKWNIWDKLWYIEKFFYDKKISRLEANWWEKKAEIAKMWPEWIEIWKSMFIPNEEWKIRGKFTWIISPAIPERYRIRFKESGVEAKVIEENRKNFVAAMRHWMEKAEGISSSSD